MTRLDSSLPSLVSASALLGALLVAPSAGAQVPGVSREQMWPAPTAEDWAKPCLITFQRSFEDALAVSKETGRPILVCVNMDGEIASEHYAGIRYRDPQMAALFEPYVCVLASVYRHTPRDYDPDGNRILCPRFGSVTCEEHIRVEPQLFGEYFEGERVAPRHIMLELDGSETYDVYYAFDTASVFEAIEKGISEREQQVFPVARGDRTIFERAQSTELSDRIAVEQAYIEGDAQTRRRLIELSTSQGPQASMDLLRLAIFGFDPELASLARQGLAQAHGEKGAALIAEALRAPMDAEQRELLIAALEKIEDVPWTAALAAAHRGLSARSTKLDPEAWTRALEAVEVPESGDFVLSERLDRSARTASEHPQDPAAQLEVAESFLILALDSSSRDKHAELALADSLAAFQRALELGASGWRTDGLRALLAYHDGDVAEGYALAEQAVEAMPPGEYGWTAMACLSLFAEARRTAIRRAIRQREEWPQEWFSDVHAAYSALSHHPLVSEGEIVSHYDFLRRIGATGPAGKVLTDGLTRFPESWELHARLRGRVLWEQGVEGLAATYDKLLQSPQRGPNLEWFAGYAALVAAEYHRRNNDPDAAYRSYDDAILHYARGEDENPDLAQSVDHFVAMARAGRARLFLERGQLDEALAELLAAFESSPDSAGSLDGIGISAVATAQMLRARLLDAGRSDAADTLQAALDALPPETRLPPAFETQGRPSPSLRGAGRQQPR